MRPSEFCAIFEKNKPGPAYFLRGPDAYLHDFCRAAAVNSIPEEARPWRLSVREFAPGEFWRELESASQVPLLGERSLLFISCSNDFGRAGEDDVEALDAYLKKPPPCATVVFAARNPDRRRRFIQLLEKGATVVELTPLSRREAAAWLADFLRKADVTIEPALAETVASRFESSEDSSGAGKETGGVNLLWLRTEMEKALAARPGERTVDESCLQLISGPREEHEIGKLIGAVAERNLSLSLKLLDGLVAGGEPEALVLWRLGDLFRQALKSGPGARASSPWSSKRFSDFEIAPRAHRAYSAAEMTRAMRLIRAADLAVKSSWKDSRLVLESLLGQIMAAKDPRSAA
ncbi:MAG: hypothetical protein KGM47_09770 [Acidobacteriota bacterium]|nr:hypothetical protein [Acidobacteriota bacterium]